MVVDASVLSTLFNQLRPERSLIVSSLESFASSVRKYMVATMGLGVLQGALNAAALLIIGVPGAFLWGMLSFLCSFIPNIGYFIAIIPPVVFSLRLGGWGTAIPVIIVYGVINALVQTVLQPRIVGNAVALSQTITSVSVLFWAIVIGPIGAILAIPLTLLVRTVLVDADPRAWWWRPVIGDLALTKELMKVEDVEIRETRRTRKAPQAKSGPNKPELS